MRLYHLLQEEIMLNNYSAICLTWMAKLYDISRYVNQFKAGEKIKLPPQGQKREVKIHLHDPAQDNSDGVTASQQ